MGLAVASFYEVLSVSSTASAEEIKAAYRAVALRCHPDKRAAQGDGPPPASSTPADFFQTAQKAYEVLRDPGLRAAHDRQLAQQQLHQSYAFQDEMDLQDMEVESGDGGEAAAVYTYRCRCGDAYQLARCDVPDAPTDVVVPCRSCSNHILVRTSR